MILVWKVLRTSVSGGCTNVEGPHSTRQQDFSPSPNTIVLKRDEEPSLTHLCFHFSLLTDESLVKCIQQTGYDSPSSHPMCTHQPLDTLQAIPLKGFVPEPLRCFSRMKAFLLPICSRSRAVLNTKSVQAQDYHSDPAMGPSYTFPFAPLQISNTHWATSSLPTVSISNFKHFESWRIWAAPAMTHLSPWPASLVFADLPLLIIHSSLGCPCHRACAASLDHFWKQPQNFP